MTVHKDHQESGLLPVIQSYSPALTAYAISDWVKEDIQELIHRLSEIQMPHEALNVDVGREVLIKLSNELAAVQQQGLDFKIKLSGSWDEVVSEEFHLRVSPTLHHQELSFKNHASLRSESEGSEFSEEDLETEEPVDIFGVGSIFKENPLWLYKNNSMAMFDQVRSSLPKVSDGQAIKIASYLLVWSEMMSQTGAEHFAPFIYNVFKGDATPKMYRFDATRVEHRFDQGLFASIPQSKYKM